MLCGICRAANSQRRLIDVEYYSFICCWLNLFILEKFDWVILPESIHRLLAHSGELIEANDGYGLGGLSEEGLEGMNKVVRGLHYRTFILTLMIYFVVGQISS